MGLGLRRFFLYGVGFDRLRRLLVGRADDLSFAPEIEVNALVLGTPYGGNCVAPAGLGRDSIVYSVGVGEDVSFDLAVIERFGPIVHAFDPTPRSIAWVKGQSLPANFVMHGVGLAHYDGVARFRPPENPTHVSHTLLERPRTEHAAIEVVVKRLTTLMQELGHRRIDLLKLDVEGAEYDVLGDILASGAEVDQMLVEFHHHLRDVPVWRTRRAIEALRNAGYRIFHVSKDRLQYSFLHERVVGSGSGAWRNPARTTDHSATAN